MAQGRYQIACPAPREFCSGAKKALSHALGGSDFRVHADHEASFACLTRSLLKQGYTRHGPRALSPPDGGPILIIPKRSRCGYYLRPGKEGNRNMAEFTGFING